MRKKKKRKRKKDEQLKQLASDITAPGDNSLRHIFHRWNRGACRDTAKPLSVNISQTADAQVRQAIPATSQALIKGKTKIQKEQAERQGKEYQFGKNWYQNWLSSDSDRKSTVQHGAAIKSPGS